MRAKRAVAVLVGFATVLSPAVAWATSRAPGRTVAGDITSVALPLRSTVDTAGVSRHETGGACGDAANATRFAFRPAADGTMHASTAASTGAFDPVLILRDDHGRIVACNDDATGTTVESALTASVHRGHRYLLEVAGQAGSTGTTQLTASVAGARPAVSGTATIAGVVTSAFDGGRIHGICVTAYDAFDDALRDTITGVTGAYRLEGLPPTHIRVGFNTCFGTPAVYQGQFWKDAPDLAHATDIVTRNGRVTRGISAALAEFGSIGGTAFDARGHRPLAGICVEAESALTHALLQTITSVTGTYRIQITSVTGEYQIQGAATADWWTVGFHDCTTGIDADQWWDGSPGGAATQAGAHPIHVDVGQAVSGIDAVMRAGGSISGTVRSLANSAALPGVCVDASAKGRPDRHVTTDSSGRYHITALGPAAYTVFFSDCARHRLSSEYWRHTGSKATATPVTVKANENTPGINANLAATGAIAGTVVDANNHKPLGAVCVSAQGDDFGSARTNGHGKFRIGGLSFGPHIVELRDCGSGRVFAFLPTYYNHALSSTDATPVVVKSGALTTITAALIRSSAVDGVVTNANHHKALAGVCVVLEDPDTATAIAETHTSVTGAYRLVAPPGSYDVRFSGCSGPSYLEQYWKAAPDKEHATPVVVGWGHDVTGIDAGLTIGATISGRVLYYDGDFGLSGTCAQARTGPSPGNVAAEAPTDFNGNYALTGLPAGRYRVELGHCHGQQDFFVPTFAFDSPTYNDAKVFTVAGGDVITGVDGNIDFGGEIEGVVRSSVGGAPVEGVCVEAIGSDPDEIPQVTQTYYDGSYFLGNLGPGEYHLRFGGQADLYPGYPCEQADVAISWYPKALDESSAKTVTLAVHQNRVGVNGVVYPPGQITGFVTAASTGKAVAVPCGRAYGSSGEARGRPVQIANGLYAIFDLPPDTYRVRISDCGSSGLASQFYDGKTSLKHATPIPLGPGQIRSDIGAALQPKVS